MTLHLDCIYLLLTVAELSLAFNVFIPSAIIHEGPPGSYFGFAVDQHVEADSNWLLVGAPKTNTSQDGVVEGGQVYKCQEASDTKRPGLSRCEPVQLDTEGNGNKYSSGDGSKFAEMSRFLNFDPDEKYPASEDKSHQWLGASVSSQEGIIVACAPRYVFFTSNLRRREPVGTCWYKTSGTSPAKEISPCRDEVHYAGLALDDQFSKYGYCQLGLAVHLQQNGEQIVMGAVGSHYWQGQVFVKNISDSTGYGLLTTRERPFQDGDAYLGYSLTVADFTGDGQDEYAVSLPKIELKGKVIVFDSDLRPMFNVSGDQLGEYFGYCVAAADLNGDGFQDLVVGAPLYAKNNTVYDTGRVFVFYLDRRTSTMHQGHQSIIEGSKKSAARFGTSVASLGDINGDNFNDIVVGAPYDGEQKAGAIYIFHGSTFGVRQEPAQVIFANEVDSGLRGFGFSVAGGKDLDKNSYPDILVGAYSSDAAVYLKSRPVVKVSVELLRMTPNIVTLEDKQCELSSETKVACLQVQSCLSYSGRGVPNGIELAINLTLDSSKESGQKRAFFKGSTSTVHVDKFTLFKERVSCSEYNVTFKSIIVDKLNPFYIQLEYNLVNLNRFELPPILDSYIPTKIHTKAEIWKNCGADNICIPDLFVKANTKATGHNVGNNNKIQFDITVHNYGEDALNAAVTLPLPPGVSYLSYADQNELSNVRCLTQQNERVHSVICSIGNPFPAGSEATFGLRVDPSEVNGSDPKLDFDFMINSSNKENSTDLKNNHWKISLDVRVVTDILMTGLSEPDQHLFKVSSFEDPSYLSDVGPEVIHIYKVRNLGPSTIKSSIVHILWPSLLDETYELLYLTKMPFVTEGLGKCEVNTVINKYRLKNGKRQQRELFDGITTTAPSFREIRCKSESASCVLIVCQLGQMAAEESATIEINSRLWLSSLEKAGLTDALIYSSANVQLVSVPYNILPDENSTATFEIKTYVANLNAGVEKKIIAWWLILTAVVAGIIVLMCIMVPLWKCGFFRRAKSKDMKYDAIPSNED